MSLAGGPSFRDIAQGWESLLLGDESLTSASSPVRLDLVGAVGIGPTTFGLKDQIRTQPLQFATVSYRKISHDSHTELLCSGLVVCKYPHKSRTVGRLLESLNPENPVPKTEAQSAEAWSADEERTVKTIQQAESVPRAEAIRRM